MGLAPGGRAKGQCTLGRGEGLEMGGCGHALHGWLRMCAYRRQVWLCCGTRWPLGDGGAWRQGTRSVLPGMMGKTLWGNLCE